jgi:predicted DNA-binding WGR domain protein
MAIVSSIKHLHITNEYNEGASYFKKFLHYAELISEGNIATARTILDGLVVNKKDTVAYKQNHIVVQQIRKALQQKGYVVDEHVGQSDFKSSLAVKASATDEEYSLSILIDDDLHYQNENVLEQYYQRPAILRDFGWRVVRVFTKDWMDNPKKVLTLILKRITEEPEPVSIPENEVQSDAVPDTQSKDESVQQPSETVLRTDHFNFERLEFSDATSNKFWESAIDGQKLIVRFGRIGTKGQTQLKSFATSELAEKEKEKMVREKIGKGYRNV